MKILIIHTDMAALGWRSVREAIAACGKCGWAVGNKENQTGHTIPKTERRKEYGQEWTEFIRFQNEELKRI